MSTTEPIPVTLPAGGGDPPSPNDFVAEAVSAWFGDHKVLVIFLLSKFHKPIWLGLDAHHFIDKPEELPPELRLGLGL